MAVESGNGTAVGNSSAVRLSSANAPANTRHHVTITNSGSNPIYVGATSAVTSSTGFPVAASGTLSGELEPNEELWGICASGQTSTFSHLRTGV